MLTHIAMYVYVLGYSAIEKKAPTTTDCGTSHNGGLWNITNISNLYISLTLFDSNGGSAFEPEFNPIQFILDSPNGKASLMKIDLSREMRFDLCQRGIHNGVTNISKSHWHFLSLFVFTRVFSLFFITDRLVNYKNKRNLKKINNLDKEFDYKVIL